MKRARYLALSAESALDAGEPLHASLAAAVAAAHQADDGERAALGEAQGGRLEAALLRLGFAPVAARAAAIDPASASAAAEGVRAAADERALARRLFGPLTYVGLVLAFQLLASVALGTFFLSLFQEGAVFSAHLPALPRAGIWLLARIPAWAPAVPLVGVVAARILLPDALKARFWQASAAQVCAAAAALERRGTLPAKSLPLLLEVAPLAAGLPARLGDGPLDAPTLDRQAQALSAEAAAAAERLRARIWRWGMAGTILLGAAIVLSVYSAIAWNMAGGLP